jgi:hypothetical protein
MPDEQRISDGQSEENRVDWLVLDLLIDADTQRPWSVAEVIREHGHEHNAIDALDRLHSAGLIHRTEDGFVFATRAAVRYAEIAG